MATDDTPTTDDPQCDGWRLVRRTTVYFVFAHLALVVILYGIFWLPYREPAKQKPPLLEILPDPNRAAVTTGVESEPSDYGWVDREAGVARIPVDQAMRVVAGRLPVREQPPMSSAPARIPTDAGSGRPVVRP